MRFHCLPSEGTFIFEDFLSGCFVLVRFCAIDYWGVFSANAYFTAVKAHKQAMPKLCKPTKIRHNLKITYKKRVFAAYQVRGFGKCLLHNRENAQTGTVRIVQTYESKRILKKGGTKTCFRCLQSEGFSREPWQLNDRPRRICCRKSVRWQKHAKVAIRRIGAPHKVNWHWGEEEQQNERAFGFTRKQGIWSLRRREPGTDLDRTARHKSKI